MLENCSGLAKHLIVPQRSTARCSVLEGSLTPGIRLAMETERGRLRTGNPPGTEDWLQDLRQVLKLFQQVVPQRVQLWKSCCHCAAILSLPAENIVRMLVEIPVRKWRRSTMV